MQYVGIQTQQSRNNLRSGILLILFPCLVAVLTYLFCYLLITFTVEDDYGQYNTLAMTNQMFINLIPYIIGGVLVWFIIAYFTNSSIIKAATGARPLERRENKRIYNMEENLCMSQGMKMPKINIIDDDSLNAYASGINEQTYTVTLSKGIIEKLNDEELEGVIAHELTHIRNHDVRLLIISIVFVGIFSMLAQIALRSVYYSSWTRSRIDKNNGAILILVLAMIVAAIGYFFATLMRFAISRKREYMADAGAAEMTKNPLALASALRKISAAPDIEAVEREDVALYKRYKEVLGDYIGSLVNFGQMKYNDSEKWKIISEAYIDVKWQSQALKKKQIGEVHSIPYKGAPNSVFDNFKDGALQRRRYYGNDGRPRLDIDMTDHGNSKEHPIVPHYHNWYLDEKGNLKREAKHDNPLKLGHEIANKDILEKR